MKQRWLSLLIALVVHQPTSAFASDANDAAAEGLFHEGRRLIDAGQVSNACPKFLASYKLSPAVGTLLNLADCYERNGQTATAWVRFREAIALSQRAGRTDRERVAEGRANALTPRLTKLLLSVRDRSVRVTRDGSEVDSAEFGTAIPVDPGPHTLHVEAPGKQAWDLTLDVLGEGRVTTVEVPELAPASSPRQPNDRSGRTGTTQRTLGLIAMGVGVVGAGVGTYFGVNTMAHWSDAKTHCNDSVCDATGVSLASDARSEGNLSTAFFLIGGALGIGGAALYFTAPKDKTIAVVPSLAPSSLGLNMGGAF